MAASLLAGCRDKEAPAAASTARRLPVTGLRTALLDSVTQLPGGQIAWATHWQLCWQPYAGAQAYELQVTTDEGTSPKLRRRTTPCYRLQVAAGRNAQRQGLLNHQQLLDLQAGQLSFRVRAVLGPATFSEWSVPRLLLVEAREPAGR